MRADTTSERTFDYSYDHALAPEANEAQLKASVTQVFYVARGFAKRGLGAGAVSPPVTSSTLNEAVESFELQPMAARAY